MSSAYGRPLSPPRNRYHPPSGPPTAPGRVSAGSFFSTTAYDAYAAPPRSSREHTSGPRASAERVDAPRTLPLKARSPPRRPVADDYVVQPRARRLTADTSSSRRPVSMVIPSSPTRRPIITSAIDRPSSPTGTLRRDRRDDDYQVLPASSTSRRHHERHSSLNTGDPNLPLPMERAISQKAYRSSNLSYPSTRERRGENDRDYGFEYTDPRDATTVYQGPSYRQRSRRDSYSNGRPTSMILPPESYIVPPNKDSGPPTSSRGFESFGRAESQRQGARAREEERAIKDYPRDDRDIALRRVPRPEIALHQPPNDRETSYLTEDSRLSRPRKLVAEDDRFDARPRNIQAEDDRFEPRPRKVPSEDDRLEMRPRKAFPEDERPETRPRKTVLEDERLDLRPRRSAHEDDRQETRPRARQPAPVEDKIESKPRVTRDDDLDHGGDERPRKHRHRHHHHRDPDRYGEGDERDGKDRRGHHETRERRDRADDGASSSGLVAGVGAAAAATGLAAEGARRHRHRESRAEGDVRPSRRYRDHLGEPERDNLETSSVSTGISEREDRDYREAREAERQAREKAELFVGPIEPVLREQASYERRPEDERPRHHRSYRPRRHHSRTRDYDSYTESSSSSSSSDDDDSRIERRPRVVTPSPEEKKEPPPPPKGILRKPRDHFPEHPETMREGVAPHKDDKKKDVPPNARWTKIDRRLVNPESLEQDGIRFNEFPDHVIVLKVMDREEIEKYTRKTAEIREKRRLLMASEGQMGPPPVPQSDTAI